MIAACASGAAVRPSPTAAGPAPADAHLVVTLRQPLAGEVMSGLGAAGSLPSLFAERADELGGMTERIVLSVLPEGRGAVLALVPRETYPAELIGWQLNVSDLQFSGGGGVRRYWSNPETGFGILVFSNLIYSFWIPPHEMTAGAAGNGPAPAVRALIRTARRGSGVPLHPLAAPLSEAHLFAYLQDVAGFAAQWYSATPGTARTMRRLEAEAAWVAGELAGLEPDDPLLLQAGVALQTDDPAPYLALTRLLLVTLLAQFDLLDAAALRGVRVGEGAPGSIEVTGLRLPRRRLAELMSAARRGADEAP